MNNNNKVKLKKLLNLLSTDDEKGELQKLDAFKVKEIVKVFKEQEVEHEDNLKKLLDSFSKYASVTTKHSQNMSEMFIEFTDSLTKKIGELGGTITTSYEKNKPANTSGVYKDMINQLSIIDQSIKNKPVPVWSWPQYASVGVRDKNFANINPATEDGNLNLIKNITNQMTFTGTRLNVDALLDVGTIEIGAVEVKPSAALLYSLSNSESTAYVSSQIIKASAGKLFTITGYNSNTSAQFIQLHDSATIPADTAIPKVIFSVPATSNFSLDFGVLAKYFTTGIVVCNSSTGPTKTIGSSDCWFSVTYI